MERTQIELDPSYAAAHYVWSWPSCLTEPQSLYLSYGTRHFPVQGYCEDYHTGSVRKCLGQSPCWLCQKGRDLGLWILSDLNLSVADLHIRRGHLWRPSLVPWSLGSDVLSSGSSPAVLAEAARSKLKGTLHREVT